jgi:hypothetical protein
MVTWRDVVPRTKDPNPRLDTVNHCLWRAEEASPEGVWMYRVTLSNIQTACNQDEIPGAKARNLRSIRKASGKHPETERCCDRPNQPLFIQTLSGAISSSLR